MFLPQYTHIVKPELKHTYLSFDEEGTLIIRSPKVSQKYIETLLLKKAGWIRRSKEKIRLKKGKMPDFRKEGGELYFLGRAYPFKIEKQIKQKTQLLFREETFFLSSHCEDRVLFQKHIDRFYKMESEKYLPAIVEKYALKMHLFPTEIRFRKTKRQWGSCSGRNVLNFNTMLMKLPESVIAYVVVHELAHIKHKNHQKNFWKLVKTYIPDYKACIAELHTYTT